MSISSKTPVHLRAGSPAQLVATLPYVFGFRPDQSVIVLGLKGRRIDAAARLDASVVLNKFDAEVLRGRLETVTGQGRQVIVVAWHDDTDAAKRAIEAVVDAIGTPDMTVIVSGGRCQADGGGWQECPDGVAEADEAGLPVLGSRGAVEARAAGPSGPEAAAAAEAWASTSESVEAMTLDERRRRAKCLMKEGLAAPEDLTIEECLELASLARQGRVRDVMTAGLTDEAARSHLALWAAVVPKVPDEGAPAVLGLMGLAAWLAGDGALQVCCVERGLALEPEHSLLRLVDTINVMGVHPREWAKVRRLR